jgi:hypothetical protein
MQKFPMPFATALGHQFCRIFAEAYLLTGNENFIPANPAGTVKWQFFFFRT